MPSRASLVVEPVAPQWLVERLVVRVDTEHIDTAGTAQGSTCGNSASATGSETNVPPREDQGFPSLPSYQVNRGARPTATTKTYSWLCIRASKRLGPTRRSARGEDRPPRYQSASSRICLSRRCPTCRPASARCHAFPPPPDSRISEWTRPPDCTEPKYRCSSSPMTTAAVLPRTADSYLVKQIVKMVNRRSRYSYLTPMSRSQGVADRVKEDHGCGVAAAEEAGPLVDRGDP
jgi:hypothetical protein